MSTTKKKNHAVATPVIAPVVVDPVPVPGSPHPPDGAVVNVKHPKLNQRRLNAAEAAATEVQAFATYADFGASAPQQGLVVDALTSLGKWRAEERAATLWQAYTRAQLAGAAAHAAVVVAPFEAPFHVLIAHRPELALSFRAMITYFQAPSDAGKQAAATRKNNRHAKAKGATAPVSGASAPAATAVVPAPSPVVIAPTGGTHTAG